MKKLYSNEELNRAKRLYQSKHRLIGDREGFALWYLQKLEEQDYCCYYCNTSIFKIKKLIEQGLLSTRSVRGSGRRGPVLEVDKDLVGYSRETSVLACYYCNNDKSNIYSKEEYKKHFGPSRAAHFRFLLANLKL